MGRITRRKLIQGGLATGAFLAAKGCGTTNSNGPKSPEFNANKIQDVTLGTCKKKRYPSKRPYGN